MTMMTVAVCGFGYWGPNHVRVLKREIGARTIVIDPDPERRAAAQSLYPDIETAPALAEAPVAPDAAIICSPPVTHEQVAGDALRAGCHVLIEKPLADTSAAGARLVALAAQHDRILMTGHTYDFHPAVARLEALAAAGDLGEIRYLDAARLSVGGYRNDVNVMWDMAPHDIVIMSRVMGAWPERVTAWADDHTGFGMNDVATMRLDFPDTSAVGYIRVSWLDPVKVRRLSVIGSQRMAVFNDAADPRTP
ncbi:MAG: Gfo/Idh/MocA family oxidoreductase, partial [Actinomycetota bacterium]